MEAKPEENNRLGKDFQVAELGPIQGPFTNPVRRPWQMGLAGFQTCHRPATATCLPFFPYLNGNVCWGYRVLVSPFYAGYISSAPKFVSGRTQLLPSRNTIWSFPLLFEYGLALCLLWLTECSRKEMTQEVFSFPLDLLGHYCHYVKSPCYS